MTKHIVIDARIRQSSTGRAIDRPLEYLQELDHENQYTILLKPGDGWQPKVTNFKTVVCPFPNFSFNPLQQIRLTRQLKSLKPDLVFFIMTGLQPLFYGGNQVTMTHDLTMYDYVKAGHLPGLVHWARMKGYRLLMWTAHKRAKHIITPTGYVRDALIKFHPFTKGKVSVAYEASEPPLEVNGEQPEGVTEPFIFHVGSPFPHKNLERLIQAFEIVHQHQPDLQLVLAGKREYYFEQLQKQIDASPARDKIHVTGFVSDEGLKWLYEHARAHVLPSLSEGFGLPGLEAMAHGCPLVSSNATCLPEVYGGAAVYFNPEDIQDMAGKISTVITDDEIRRSLVEFGNERITHYSWRNMSKEMLAVFKQALGS